jgi:hypothetical protein
MAEKFHSVANEFMVFFEDFRLTDSHQAQPEHLDLGLFDVNVHGSINRLVISAEKVTDRHVG